MSHLTALARCPHDFSVYTEALRTILIIGSVFLQMSILALGIFPLINVLMSRNWMRRIRRCIHLTGRALSNPTYWISLDDRICTYVVPMRWLRRCV